MADPLTCHPDPDVAWLGTARSVTPACTPVLEASGYPQELGFAAQPVPDGGGGVVVLEDDVVVVEDRVVVEEELVVDVDDGDVEDDDDDVVVVPVVVEVADVVGAA